MLTMRSQHLILSLFMRLALAQVYNTIADGGSHAAALAGAPTVPQNLSHGACGASILEFGAVGDGVHDDTGPIQAALNSGKSLYVPQGKFQPRRQVAARGTV